MICVIALVVFGILGIFSATHRKLAYEAFDCVFRRITLRKCESRLDERLKSQITGRLMRKSPKLAGWTFKNFEILSWIFLILMVLSIVYSGIGVYNYAVYGNCQGPTGGFCIFDPIDSLHSECSLSEFEEPDRGGIVYPTADDDPSAGPEDAPVTIIEFACFSCPYSKEAAPIIKEVVDSFDGKVRLVYRDFPIHSHGDATLISMAAECAHDQGNFWKFYSEIYSRDDTGNMDLGDLYTLAGDLGLDQTRFELCLRGEEHKDEVEKDIADGKKAGVYGTPTFFINGEVVVGPKPAKTFKKIINDKLEQLG